MTKMRDEPFISRWSRRKLETADEARPDDVPTDEVADTAPDEEEQAALQEAQALTEEDVEKLEADSDFSIFMRKGVAPHVKKLALRKLWRSSPVLANLDGLNDYDGDFTDAATNMKNVASGWMAGRGFGLPPSVESAVDEITQPPDSAQEMTDGEHAGERHVPPDAEEEAGNEPSSA